MKIKGEEEEKFLNNKQDEYLWSFKYIFMELFSV